MTSGMYRVARLLLQLATVAGVYSLALFVVLGWPASGFIAAGVAVILWWKQRPSPLTTLGSAKFANERELRNAGMLDAESGLILGRLPEPLCGGIVAGKLFDRRLSAAAACGAFWSGFMKSRGPVVRLPQAVHSAIFAPSGGGKGVSLVLPFLLACRESCIVVDFKGENAALTAEHRRKVFGHHVVLLDPFKVVTLSPDTFNPLDFIDKHSAEALDECNDLAKALVVRSPEEKEPHWGDSAEAWIAALIATVVQYGDAGESRSLQTVRDLMSSPQKLDTAVRVMLESGDCWNGMLARMGGQLLHFVEKERSSTLTSASRHLRFLDSLAVAASTATSSFDPAELRNGKMTIFLVLPPEHMRAQSALLRLWITALLRAVIKGGLQETNKVHVILDEFASLQHLEIVDDLVDKYRGYGCRGQFYCQSLGQLKTCFPNGQDQTFLSNVVSCFFNVNDNFSAEYVSTRLGESTIIVRSGGSGFGFSRQHSTGVQPQGNRGDSSNTSNNWQPQARKLLTTSEVMTLPERTAITFVPGMAPICTTLLRYYEERQLGRHGGVKAWLAACCTLIGSAALCIACVVAAIGLTFVVARGL